MPEVDTMKKLFYPAVFHKAEEGGYWITFPDIPECMTQGETMEEAYRMAFDALGLALTDRQADGETLPLSSAPEQISLESDSFLVVVEFDFADYRRKHSTRSVKKTLSIPEWLNEAATAAGLNFSQVLQEALIQKTSRL